MNKIGEEKTDIKVEERMRLFANYLIDRFLEEDKNSLLMLNEKRNTLEQHGK